jgi:predicted dehydrogenase
MGYDSILASPNQVLSHARAFSNHTAFRLLAGVDPDPERRTEFFANYRAPAYWDLKSALDNHAPDIVVISVPTGHHAGVIEQVIQYSAPRAVLCEKPIAFRPDEAEEIVSGCEKSGIALYVNYIRRSVPGVLDVKRMLDSKIIQKPIKGVCWYTKGLIHSGSHFVNLAEFWLGPTKGATLLSRGRQIGEHDFEADFRIEFDQGEMIFLSALEESFTHHTLELVSSSGRLRLENGGDQMTWEGVAETNGYSGQRGLNAPVSLVSGMNRYQWHVTNELARALTGQYANICSGRDALSTLQTISRIDEMGMMNS